MISVNRSAVAGLMVLSSALFACKFLKMSPAKACKKMSKIYEDSGKTQPLSNCEESLAKMQKDDPDAYKCVTNCIKKADTHNELNACGKGCSSPSSSGGDGTLASTKSGSSYSSGNSAVDSLSEYSVKSKLSSKFSYTGYKMIGETTNSLGWAGTVMIGQAGSDIDVYRVILADVTSSSEGYSLASKLKAKTSSATSYKVGNSKLIYIECKLHKAKYETGSPKTCSSYNSRISSVMSALAGY